MVLLAIGSDNGCGFFIQKRPPFFFCTAEQLSGFIGFRLMFFSFFIML